MRSFLKNRYDFSSCTGMLQKLLRHKILSRNKYTILSCWTARLSDNWLLFDVSTLHVNRQKGGILGVFSELSGPIAYQPTGLHVNTTVHRHSVRADIIMRFR